MRKFHKKNAALATAILTITATALTANADEPFITCSDPFTVSYTNFEAVMDIYAKTPHALIVCSTDNISNVSNATSKIKTTCEYVDSSGNEKEVTYNRTTWSYQFYVQG